MKVLSLFDGISCGMAAFERADIPVERYAAYEIDKYIQYKENLSHYRQAAEVREVKLACIKLTYQMVIT